jgi:hypothetical protein
MKDLAEFKNRILFNEIHDEFYSDRDARFSEICDDASFLVRHNFEKSDSDGCYILYCKLAGAVIRKEMLIALCKDLKQTLGPEGWKSLHGVWNDGDETYYEDQFSIQIESAKKLMLKLRPFVIDYTKSWTAERKQMDLNKPEGRFMKGWYLEGELKKRKLKL